MTESELRSGRQYYRSRDWVSLFFKGMIMGAADVVPGVSGGTIAFITGIYDRLIDALKSLTPTALRVLFRQGFFSFWRHIDGRFLTTLFSGIFISVFSLAKVIGYALDAYPILIGSFFFGLVLASTLYLMVQMPQWRKSEVFALLMGSIFAWLLTDLRPVALPGEWWVVMLAGSVAICAMILPGISGSFILLLMGMYSLIINAIRSIDLPLLMSFAVGCGFGLLLFSHLLSWLMHRFRSTMYAVLTGFLIGSLNMLWPWKQTLETTLDHHGELTPLVQVNVLPAVYAHLTGKSSMLAMALMCALLGLAFVFLLEKLGSER